MAHLRKLHPSAYYQHFLLEKRRPDGRSLEEMRSPISITLGQIGSAYSSSLVRLGNTMICCGINIHISDPLPTEPEHGFFAPNIDLSPISSAQYRPGPPSDKAQQLSALLESILAKTIDKKDLCISVGKKVWCIYADLIVLNDDGNLFDCALLAIMATLNYTKLPVVLLNEFDEILVDEKVKSPLKLKIFPLSTSFVMPQNRTFILDPTELEEEVCLDSLSVIIDVKTSKVVNHFKVGAQSISSQEISNLTRISKECALLQLKAVEKSLLKYNKKNEF